MWGREWWEGRAAAVLAFCPACLAKAHTSGTVANGRRDISAALPWDTVGRKRNVGAAVVEQPVKVAAKVWPDHTVAPDWMHERRQRTSSREVSYDDGVGVAKMTE